MSNNTDSKLQALKRELIIRERTRNQSERGYLAVQRKITELEAKNESRNNRRHQKLEVTPSGSDDTD